MKRFTQRFFSGPKEKMNGMKHNEGDRKLYYISAEFLVGKLLSNNLINLGVFEEVREVLKKTRTRSDRD